MPKPIPSHDDVRSAFDDGSIINASKEELERFLVANGQARILHEANQARASEMGETMRQLLAARQSEEMHSQALRISKVALYISVAAFVVGVLAAIPAYLPLVNPKPTEVYSLQTMPVRVENASVLNQPHQVQKQTPQQSKTQLQHDKSGQGHAKN